MADLKIQLFVDKVPQMVDAFGLSSSGFMYTPMTTTQRDAVVNPQPGTVIFNTTTNKLNVRGASAWEAVTSA